MLRLRKFFTAWANRSDDIEDAMKSREIAPIYCKPWRTIVFVTVKQKASLLAKNSEPAV